MLAFELSAYTPDSSEEILTTVVVVHKGIARIMDGASQDVVIRTDGSGVSTVDAACEIAEGVRTAIEGVGDLDRELTQLYEAWRPGGEPHDRVLRQLYALDDAASTIRSQHLRIALDVERLTTSLVDQEGQRRED